MKNSKLAKFLWFVIGTILIVVCDQITKVMAVNVLKGKKPFAIIDGVLEFNYLENKGAAWGMMSGARVFFLVLTVVILVAVAYVVVKIPEISQYKLLLTVCTLLSGGAIGNFIDRAYLQYVRDFIYFKLINFPVFNVADIAVTLSVIFLIIAIFFVYDDDAFNFLPFVKDEKHE